MNILITGSRGQLATEFQGSLLKHNHEVTALDKQELDITDMKAVSDRVLRISPDVIINCAAYNYVDDAEDDFDSALKVNAIGVKNLAVSCREHSVSLVHFSSDYVFDGRKEGFYTEDDEPNPINRYGESKLQGENFLKQEAPEYLLFRVSWVFGKGRQNFLYKLSEWAKEKKILKIVYDQISVPTYTEDIVSITLFAIQKGLRGLYHLTNSGYATRYEVARYFLEKINMHNLIFPVPSDIFPSPAKRPFFSVMSNQRISRDLDVELPDWRLGIDRYISAAFKGKET